MKEVIKADSLHRLNEQVTEFVENHLSMADNLTIVTTINDGEYVATVMPQQVGDALKRHLVDEGGYVDVFWHEDDIRERLTELHSQEEIPTDMVSDTQMQDIKHELSSTHDAENGLTWESIDCAIMNAFENYDEDDDDSDPDEACERDRILWESDGDDEYEWNDSELS